ncbi:TPA: hypothetical protein U2M14_002194 [Enterobacter roggenkampii]|uniref:hypothetical protein n=1 Tax=Enterobacter TaxID=547 RepID=UPI000667ECEC|nr:MULTISPECIES: hypothetical protein [Enterobacter]HAS1170409.1 hypothetical protein [Enterobacter cloacae]RTN61154.1 hypothetical protein EKN82_08850 [Enterobacter ludwigii]URR09743.1 hypothetical protein L1S38_08270 [Enterobacter roggenkampii]HCR0869298.1 hypothetical protein [Enterobacter roggenkampii]HCR1007585.1 hypothetical protein [Enterobacter roggenkampii]
MKTSERYPVTQGDVIVNYASSLFDRTEVTAPSLPADVFCGDILDSKTFALYDSAAAVGEPVINLSDMSADGQNKTLVIVDRHVVITDHFLRAKDAASKKAALTALTASGDVRLAINADYFKA